jgi:hypothetical protein
MIREDNYGTNRSGQNWRRNDCGTIAPFSSLPKEDVVAFKYAVLEVKLQTQLGTEAPEWVKDLISGHLVEEVPKFSKFVHGVATLLEDKVELLPFWLPQMDKDIRKPAISPVGFKSSLRGSQNSKESVKDDQISIESANHVKVCIDEPSTSIQLHDESLPLLGEETKKDVKKVKGKKSLFDLSSLLNKPEHINSSIPQRMNNKRIILPVRVEPKVFFANERTFLSWLHFCIVLGGLALGLLNFGDDAIAQISGIIFTVVSMIFMVYALYLYQWRAHKIRMRGFMNF